MKIEFYNISKNWDTSIHREVECQDSSNEAFSLKGRAICLAHTLGTPLIAWQRLGSLAYTIAESAMICLCVLTFNAKKKYLLQAGANIIDASVGLVLLPFALSAHIIRGVAGTILHPGLMIKYTPLKRERHDYLDFHPEVEFYNTSKNWDMIAHRKVECQDSSNETFSLKGRAICLAHTLGTPLIAWQRLGSLAGVIAESALICLCILTFNSTKKKYLLKAGANIIDASVGLVLLPFALSAHIIRGVAGTILHPGLMIKCN